MMEGLSATAKESKHAILHRRIVQNRINLIGINKEVNDLLVNIRGDKSSLENAKDIADGPEPSFGPEPSLFEVLSCQSFDGEHDIIESIHKGLNEIKEMLF